MSTQRFSTGKRFRWENTVYEVKRLLPEGQIQIEALAEGATRSVAQEQLVQALFSGTLYFETPKTPTHLPPRPDPVGQGPVTPSDYPVAQAAIGRHRLEVIEPLLALPPERRTKTAVQAHVMALQAAKPAESKSGLIDAVSTRSIYRWMASYLHSGNDWRVLVPRTRARGGKRQSRLAPDVIDLVEGVIRDNYYRRETVTQKDIYTLVAARIEEENRQRAPGEKMNRPSRGTIARRIEAQDLRARFTAKHGRRAARREFTQVGQTCYPNIPLERVEIDHTRIDLIVLDEEDNLVLGRPTLTICKDSATRYPLGYYVGFEPPSYYTVMECLYHAIRPKENVRGQFGAEHDWKAYGIPTTLVVDHGVEFIGQDLKDACTLLNIQLTPAPVATPEFKAGIERQFGTLNTGLFHTLPGTTFSNPRQRGDYDSTRQACISLKELEKALNLFIVDVYAEDFHRGLNGIPARRWEAALAEGFSPRLPADPKELLILLSRVAWRTVQASGIEFESLRYNCAELGVVRDHLRTAPDKRVKIKYHPGDLSRLYVFDPMDQAYLEVPALDQGYTRGLSLWKHRVIWRFASQEQDKVDPAALGRAKGRIQAIVDDAKARKKAGGRLGRWASGGHPPSLKGQAADGPEPAETPLLTPQSAPPQAPPGAAPESEQTPPDARAADDDWELDYRLDNRRAQLGTTPEAQA
jgi:putative transposase